MIVAQILDQVVSHIDYLERSLAEADALLAAHAGKIDQNQRQDWPQTSALKSAILRHERRQIEAEIKNRT
jgi:hypothetical protein